MKKNYLKCLAIAFIAIPTSLFAQLAEVETPFSFKEDFGYAANTNLGQNAESTAKGWQNYVKGTVATKIPLRTINPGLTYSGFTDETSNCIEIVPPTDGTSVNSSLRWNLFGEENQLRDGTIYFSMLINVKDAFADHTEPFFSCFRLADKVNYSLGSGSNGNIYIVKNDESTYKIGITRFNVNKNNSIEFVEETFQYNQVYHIVFKLNYGMVTKEIEGVSTTIREETASLYVDPNLDNEPVEATVSQGSDVATAGKGSAVNHMAFVAQNAHAPHMQIDRIRIANTWTGLSFPTTGITNNLNQDKITTSVTNGELTINGLEEGEVIQLFNTCGVLIHQEKTNKTSVKIPSLTKGLYLVKVGKKVIKVVV